MNTLEKFVHLIPDVEAKLNYHFRDRSLLTLAFVHCSFVNESRLIVEHNERLEFLGDSILGMFMAEYVYVKHPEMPEGDLSSIRSRLVDASACVGYIQKLDLGKYLLLGKGERMNDGRGRESILADLFEAIIAAIYLDGGLEAARKFVFGNFLADIEALLHEPLRNSKAILQEHSQKVFRQAPLYEILEESGPDHSKTFCVAVIINGDEYGRGYGVSKKEAQQAAATDALTRISYGRQ